MAQLVTGHHWVTKLKSGTAVQHFRDKSEISCVMFADGEVHPGMADTFAEALDDMPANFVREPLCSQPCILPQQPRSL